MPKGGGVWVTEQNALFKIVTKQCLGHLMILGGGQGAERFI